MRVCAADAYKLLPRVDPGRLLAGRAVGLRDGALLALIAAGLTFGEISKLQATAIKLIDGQVQVSIQRQGIIWSATLPTALGARLLAWTSECRLWGEAEPVFTGRRGSPLTPGGVGRVFNRYRLRPPTPARKRIKRRKRK
jgi:hypothetical protein